MYSSRGETGKEDQSFVSRGNCENTRMCWTLRSKEALAGGDRSAKRFGISRKVTRTAFFMFKDERYAAGAGMRRSGACQSRAAHEDERYAAGAGMRTTAGKQEVEQRRSSCRGAARVNLALHMRMNGYVQDERYIAIEHRDVRCDCLNLAQPPMNNLPLNALT